MAKEDPAKVHTRFSKQFEAVLGQLNLAQRAAVTQIEGPVMVLAGPGTGKTHMLAARIGYILRETDASPHTILCLTFTDAAAYAMRQRLLTFIGPEAHKVHIYTFHAFCNAVIQQNLDYFGWKDLEPVSAIERIEICQSLIDALPLNHPLKQGKGDIYFFVPHLIDLFRVLKSEDWKPKVLIEQLSEYAKALPLKKEYQYQRKFRSNKVGDPKEKLIREERRRIDRLVSAIYLFERYNKKMIERRRYDYEDMISWTLDAFQKSDYLLRRYQEQYQYVLVDEFQDTNGAQNRLLLTLMNYWEFPNLFIVGDDDQSIYEFQGARLQNLLDIYNRYKAHLSTVVLTENYRSTPSILEAASTLITYNELRVNNKIPEVEKRLEAAHPDYKKLTIQPQVFSFPNSIQEQAFIIQEVMRLKKEGCPLEEIAILYARHQEAAPLIRLFERFGLPYQTRRQINVLDEPLIQQLLDMFHYFAQEITQPFSGEAQLYKILHFPHWGIEPYELAQFIYKTRRYREGDIPLRILLQDVEQLKALSIPEITGRLYQISLFLEETFKVLASQSLTYFLEFLLNQSGFLQHILKTRESVWHVQLIQTFFRFIHQEEKKIKDLPLQGFLTTISKMRHHRVQLPLERKQVDAHGVQFTTVHSAKGLEYQHVYVIDAVQHYWGDRSGSYRYRFSFPMEVTLSNEYDVLESRRRLFYVAMTRAKKSLTISFGRTTPEGKERHQSQFVDELGGPGAPIMEKKTVSADWLSKIEATNLIAAPPPATHLLPEQIDALLEDFVLSVSALNTYLSCPQAFYYEYVLRIPATFSERAIYGISVHQAIYQFLTFHKKEVPAGEKELQQFFKEAFEAQAYLVSKENRAHYFQKGWTNLSLAYSNILNYTAVDGLAEYRVHHVEVEGVPIKGHIDRISFTGPRQAVLVDFKTGTAKEAKVAPPTEKKPEGGSYWRQLVFYALLFEADKFHQRVVDKGVIQHIDPNVQGEILQFEVTIDQGAKQQMRDLIKTTHEKIQNRAFEEACQKPTCPWCQLLHLSQHPSRLANTIKEEMDDHMEV